MTKIQNPATFVARLAVDEAAARKIASLLAELLDPFTAVCSTTARPDGRWQVDVHFKARPDLAHLRRLVEVAAGPKAAAALAVEKLAPRDWVKTSLIGLRPVTAGRFVVHGSHDRARVPAHRIGIEIEAAQAFGTGHHGTTRGCLVALDMLSRRRRPRHILDLGTGTGVLAIAAAKLLHTRVLASDIDRRSVETARDNARSNRVGPLVSVVQGAGLTAAEVRARAPFDLVMANILLAPLRRLAAPIARQIMPNANVVISGLLREHASAAIAAYRSQGLVLERSIVFDGWSTLVMSARAV